MVCWAFAPMVWPKNFVGAEVMLRVVPCWRLKVVWLWVFLPLNMYDTHCLGGLADLDLCTCDQHQRGQLGGHQVRRTTL